MHSCSYGCSNFTCLFILCLYCFHIFFVLFFRVNILQNAQMHHGRVYIVCFCVFRAVSPCVICVLFLLFYLFFLLFICLFCTCLFCLFCCCFFVAFLLVLLPCCGYYFGAVCVVSIYFLPFALSLKMHTTIFF